MPWKETCPMDERVAFIGDYVSQEWTVADLARRYGISRKTAHKWIGRYGDDPEAGLCERSRAPYQHGRAMKPAVAAAVCVLRRAHRHWGPRKMRAWLVDQLPEVAWPAASTIGDLLRREGLSERHGRKRYVVPLTRPFAPVVEANDLWTTDFKGWYRTADGSRCDPLTVIDSATRFVLACRIVSPTRDGVQPWFERLFREQGLPRAIRTDNGPPFASTGPARLSRLSVWWLKLGIQVERIRPGHPEENGRHERFHRTLDLEAGQPAATPRALQQRFDRTRREFNEDRPHEALGNVPPARLYRPAPRPYPDRLEEFAYPMTTRVRHVRGRGEIKWNGELVFLTEALAGETVGVSETETGDWRVAFMHLELGRIDRHSGHFTPAWHGPAIAARG
jgi:putative transposase